MMTRFLVVIILFAASAAAQETAGLSVEPSAENVAVLFTMTDEGGRLRNLQLMKSVFEDGTLGFRVESHHNVPSPFIYSRLEELARGLDEGGTLLVYLNSHGGGSGDRFAMTAKGGSFKFSKALDALGKSGRPLKRLVLLVDTCHAEGSIQDSTGEDGQLLRNLKIAQPTSFLPELPDSYDRGDLPFIAPFVNLVPTDRKYRGQTVVKPVVDYGQDSGVYEEMLIISSSSVEDYSIRGVFAERLASTFRKVKELKGLTLGEFLKMFADSHGKSGQQPHYKVIPDGSMFKELLFGPWFAQTIPIINHSGEKPTSDLVPVPRK
jgi:hypothetical protein